MLAKTFGRNKAQDSTKAVKQIESFAFDDQTPTTTISSPPSGLLNTTSFVASGTATDDNGVNELTYWFRNATNQYLQDDGSVASTFNTFRGEPDVVGATAATWRYEVNLPSEGDWRMSATAIDNAGQADLRSAVRDWTISAAGSPPTVAISAPATMTPPTAASPVTVTPGQPLTFAGTATDDDRLQDVEIYLRNSSTGEALAADGTWSANSVAAFHRISPSNMTTSSYSWGYTTPFDLTPGTYDFRVRATDNLGLITSGTNQGRLTINAQTDAFPNGLLSFTGVEQNVETLHLDLGGTATDDLGVSAVRVALYDLDTGRYVQPDGTMAAGFAAHEAALGTPGATSTSFTLSVDLPTKGEFLATARAVDTSGQQDNSTTGATARYLVYPGDLDPTLSEELGQPRAGAVFTERIVVSGRAFDDVGVARVELQIVDGSGRYMSSTGLFSPTVRWLQAFVNSPGTPGSNYSYTSPIVAPGTYSVNVRAVDNYGQLQQTPRITGVTVNP